MTTLIRTLPYILSVYLLYPTMVCAHSGGTDSNGGHHNRKTGEYHYHNSGYKKSDASSNTGSTRSQGQIVETQEAADYRVQKFREDYSRQVVKSGGAYKRARETLGLTPEYVPASDRKSKVVRYFWSGNERATDKDCFLTLHERNVAENLKSQVVSRDNNLCIVCGSRQGVSIDHIKALPNGGDNSADNLAILCGECRREKNSLDKWLKEDRDSICRIK